MARPFTWDVDPANADDNGIADDLGTGTDWSLSGDAEWLASSASDSLAHRLIVTTAGNEPASNAPSMTLTGTSANGDVLTDTVVLPNATTVETTEYFLTVTSATTSGDATVGTCDIGWVDEVVTATYPLNHRGDVPAAYVVSGSSGTYSAAIEETFVDFQNKLFPAAITYAPVWLSNQGTPAGTTAIDIAQPGLPNATGARIRLISYTDTAELQFSISQRSSSD